MEGEEEGEDGSAFGGLLAASYAKGAVVFFDDVFADPEACAVHALGGEEGFEDALLNVV